MKALIFQIGAALVTAGFTVKAIIQTNPGAPDEKVLEIAEQDRAVIITSDKDFGELCIRRKVSHSGVILLRLPDINNAERSEIVKRMLAEYSDEIEFSFSVVTKKKVRIRKM